MKTYKWFVITALVLALIMPVTPAGAAPPPPSASNTLTAPSPNPGRVGSEVSFALILTVENINPGVTAAEIYLAYDDTLVAPPTSPLGVVEALPDFFGVSNVSINEVLPKAQCPGMTSPCIHLAVAGPAQTTHSGAAARFHFRGIKDGNACFRLLVSTMVNADGFPVTHVQASPVCVPIIRTTIGGTVKRQGTPASPNPGGGTPACSEVKATSGALTVGPVFTDGLGAFNLTDMPSGAHTLHAEYSGYLASEKTIAISAGGPAFIDVGTTTLLGGDVNGDKSINILDIGKIISLFGNTGVPVRSDAPDCTDPDEPTDINDDGNINISDLAIAAGNWGRTGPTPWP
jgi:hypothetical protein